MIEVHIDESYVNAKVDEVIERKVETSAHRYTFWDMKELSRQTQMSIPFIKEQFFYDERFPKKKIGTKWFMPAKEAEMFLRQWWNEQSSY